MTERQAPAIRLVPSKPGPFRSRVTGVSPCDHSEAAPGSAVRAAGGEGRVRRPSPVRSDRRRY
eukprot:752435-Hanusia_phi.AAC.1